MLWFRVFAVSRLPLFSTNISTAAADSTDIRAITMELFGVLLINVIVVLLVPVASSFSSS